MPRQKGKIMETANTPGENENFDCHLQQIGMGTLICRAARLTGERSSNETTPALCAVCDAGKIFREVGCDAVTPKIHIWPCSDGPAYNVESLFCNKRKRNTTLEFCKTCNLVTAETTKQITASIKGLFTAQEFYSAYKDLERARESLRDGNFENAITRSIAFLESSMIAIHEKLGEPLPSKKQVSDLWKSTRSIVRFDEISLQESPLNLINSLSGVIVHLGELRNKMSDAHGKGVAKPEVFEYIAELAINIAATLATIMIRRFNQIKDKANG